MNAQESTLITELFDRIAQNSAQQRDQEAEQLIRDKMAANPHAPYVLAQSTIILQQAVSAAQSRIADLEKQLSETKSQSQGGGFLSGVGSLFGAPQPPQPPRPATPPPIPQQAPAPAGGGFLQNAMATAAGVAGGALLFQGIENLMGHGGGFGGGGFASQGQPAEVINNYYMDQDQNGGDPATGNDDQGDLVADNDDQDFGSGFDDGGDDPFA